MELKRERDKLVDGAPKFLKNARFLETSKPKPVKPRLIKPIMPSIKSVEKPAVK